MRSAYPLLNAILHQGNKEKVINVYLNNPMAGAGRPPSLLVVAIFGDRLIGALTQPSDIVRLSTSPPPESSCVLP
jgi:hypothetical protein